MIVVKENKTYTILFFLLLVALGFGNFNLKLGFSIKPYMIVSFVTLLLTIRNHKIIYLRNYEKVMCIYLFFYIFTIVQFRYFVEGLWFTFLLMLIALFYFIFRRIIIYITIANIERAILFSGIIITLSSLYYYYIGISSFGFFPSETGIIKYGVMIDRYMFRLTGTINEPNIASVYLCFFFFYYYYNIKKGNLYILGSILSFITIALTLSRGAYLSVLATFLVLPFISNNRKQQFKKLVRILIAIVFIVALLYFVLLQYDIDILEPVLGRFNDIGNDSGSGRLELWECALSAFLTSPLIGIGLNGIRAFNIEHFGPEFGNYTHNSYLEVLAESGVIGFSLYLLLISMVLIRLIRVQRKDSRSSYLLASLLCVLFQISLISVQHNEFFFFLILMTFRYDVEFNIKITDKKFKLLSFKKTRVIFHKIRHSA